MKIIVAKNQTYTALGVVHAYLEAHPEATLKQLQEDMFGGREAPTSYDSYMFDDVFTLSDGTTFRLRKGLWGVTTPYWKSMVEGVSREDMFVCIAAKGEKDLGDAGYVILDVNRAI